MKLRLILSALLLVTITMVSPALQRATIKLAEWPQWGGPNRNFILDTKGLAASWPANGPRRLWNRDLGEGHSMVVAEQGRLYTMYSKGEQEFVVALEATSGKTLWEKPYAAAPGGLNLEHGKGPHSTPLLVGEVLYTIGVKGKFHALDKQSGKVIWVHDLWSEYGGTQLDRGYSCSPLAYKNTVIVTVGGKGQALMAFDQKTGAVVWKKQDFAISPSSPVLINVDGQDQLVGFLADHIIGVNPNNGELLWSHPHQTSWGLNITPPIWGESNLLFCSSAYNGGSRVLQLNRNGDKTTVKELWANRRVRVHHGTAIRLGELVYASNGDFGPAPMTAVNVKTGEVAWQDRTFPKANFLYADGKVVLLDEDGNLALVTLSPQGMKVISKASVLVNRAWTAPTLAGTKLYVRDRRTIAAFDLS